MPIVEIGEHHFHMDGYLKSNLDYSIKEVKRRNFDKFVLVFGREGYGKTTMALQMALYCDPTFDLSRVCFTPEQFLDAVECAEKFQAVVFDETMWGLSSRAVMTRMNRYLIKIISEMRSKNLFVFMCIPSIFIMDWYVAQHRSTAGIYVYKRGEYASYDYPTKKKLYMEGKRNHSYHVPPNFRGRFTKHFPVSQEEYEKKKQEAISGWADEKKKESLWKHQRDLLIVKSVEDNLMNRKEVADVLGMSTMQIGTIIRENGG